MVVGYKHDPDMAFGDVEVLSIEEVAFRVYC